MQKGKFFKLVRIKFEGKVSGVQKKLKTNFRVLDLDKKIKSYFFQKYHVPAIRDNFFSDHNQKMRK